MNMSYSAGCKQSSIGRLCPQLVARGVPEHVSIVFSSVGKLSFTSIRGLVHNVLFICLLVNGNCILEYNIVLLSVSYMF